MLASHKEVLTISMLGPGAPGGPGSPAGPSLPGLPYKLKTYDYCRLFAVLIKRQRSTKANQRFLKTTIMSKMVLEKILLQGFRFIWAHPIVTMVQTISLKSRAGGYSVTAVWNALLISRS